LASIERTAAVNSGSGGGLAARPLRSSSPGAAVPQSVGAAPGNEHENDKASSAISTPRCLQKSAACLHAARIAGDAGCQGCGPWLDNRPSAPGDALSRPMPRAASDGTSWDSVVSNSVGWRGLRATPPETRHL